MNKQHFCAQGGCLSQMFLAKHPQTLVILPFENPHQGDSKCGHIGASRWRKTFTKWTCFHEDHFKLTLLDGWKYMEIQVSFWDGLCSGDMLVLGRVIQILGFDIRIYIYCMIMICRYIIDMEWWNWGEFVAIEILMHKGMRWNPA